MTEPTLRRARTWLRALGRLLFGDRRGLAVFLGALCFFGLYWRIGVYITDTNTIANTLLNVADGRLSIVEAPYGNGRDAAGTHRANGRIYGRSYGIIYLAVPVLWTLEAVSSVLSLRVVVIALWSLVVVGFLTTVGRLLERDWLVVGGSVLAVVAFVGNVAIATPLSASLVPILALQLVTLVATALTGVILYRLLAVIATPRLGCMGATAAIIGTPLAFWASFPKRHAFTALVVVTIMYGFARSRRPAHRGVYYRALSYAAIGFLAVVHAAEALFLLGPLIVIDVATAPTNDRRTVGIVVGVFVLSLIPFFLTNVAISGNPLEPPRMLPKVEPLQGELDLSTGGGGPSSGSDGGGGGGVSVPFVDEVISITAVFGSLLWTGIETTVTHPIQVYQTFLRGGYLSHIAPDDGFEAISLTVLESAPLVAGLVGAPLALGTALRTNGWLHEYRRSPAVAVDLYALACSLLLVFLYIERLPTNAQVTVRYLHPLFPVAIYALVRLPRIRRVLDTHWQTALWSATGTVAVGGQLVIAFLGLTAPGLGEAVQFHALLGIAAGTLLAVWIVAASLVPGVPDRAGAVTLGFATGVGTIFVLLSGIVYFDYAGTFALPAVGILSDALPLV